MKKIILFILILCCTPISFLFGASSKLVNPAQPEINPVQTALLSEQVGPENPEKVVLPNPKLKYRGTLLLTSPHPAFGGFSDFLISKDRTTFLAVSDMGFWLKGKLNYTPSGFLKSVEREAELGQLLDTKGKTFSIKYNADAEGLCRAPQLNHSDTSDSGYLVSFERVHRINHYNSGKHLDLSGKATTVPLPELIRKSPLNGGIESMLLLPDNTLFVLTEDGNSDDAISAGALLNNGEWLTFKYKRNSDFRPTSAGNLNNDKILVLERRYKGPGTLGIRINTIERDKIVQGKTVFPDLFCNIIPPIPRDNYEGMDTVMGPGETIWIYIISDDNFSPAQHTLLTLFELDLSAEN
ncbi:esterase-like activity of phytase family protein [Maridesulfovibrio sp.]|uniref:esterase-like activity of phytase family protein n=1 Tax=unclassified Maridesulfovibrio TaxID=2794999 RepID=UPI003B007BD3